MPNTLQGMNWCRKDFRLACYLRGGAACVWCAQGIEDGITLALDHVVPREQGGNNSAYNVVCACHRCENVTMDDSGYLHLWFNAAEDDGVQVHAHELFDEEGMRYDLSGLD